MDLAACRPSLAGRNQRVAEIRSVPVGEKHGSGAEFSAAATVVEVRQRKPALQSVRDGIGFASIWHLVCSRVAMDAAHRGEGPAWLIVCWLWRRRRMALLVLVVVAGLAALFLIPGSTPRIDTRRYPNSLAVLEQVPVNDTQQWILIRSARPSTACVCSHPRSESGR